jgi:hypothetical protein
MYARYRPTAEPAWKTVQGYSLTSRISPHYRYHNSAANLSEFMLICDLKKLTAAEQASFAAEIIDRLEQGRPQEVRPLLRELQQRKKAASTDA